MSKYSPQDIEKSWYDRWEENNYFAPSGQGQPFSIAIPPPNVTGTLHMGHAFQHRLVDTVWTGESARASVEDVAVFLANVDETYHLEDRGFDDEPVQDGRFFNPFINLTTLDIIKLYKEHGLEETLLPLTYSCDEWSNDYTKPCGVCSNCLEREWAITSVFPLEPHTTLESALANYNMG